MTTPSSLRAAALLGLLCAAAARPAHAQDLTFPELPAEARVHSGVTIPCTVPNLLGSARCGVFRVWEDREAQRGRTIDIAFVVLAALDSTQRAADAIVLLPGGPGQAFTDGTVAGRSNAMRALREQRDVVLVDVRGVFRSAGLSCTVPFPGGFRSRFGTMFPLDHAAACRDDLAQRADLEKYTTAASVDDLEDLRHWLGYPQVNLMGTSYGTRVGQVYMRRHPQSIRTVVLNGVAPVWEPLYVQHASLLQRALDRLVGECRDDAECHAAYPDLDARLIRLLARFEGGPVPVSVNGEEVDFSSGDLAYALRGMLYARAAELPRMIHSAADGPLDALVEYYVQRTDWVGGPDGETGYHYSVLCAEDIDPLTDAEVAKATAGTFMRDHLITGYRNVCRVWPHATMPAEHWQPVRSDIPTLLLSGSRDPVTPPEGGAAVAQYLPRSVHVVVPNGGHGVGGACVGAMTLSLIENGNLDGVDTACIVAVPRTPFVVAQAVGN